MGQTKITLTMDPYSAKCLALLLNSRNVTATVVPGPQKWLSTITIDESGRDYADGFMAGMQHVTRHL